LKNLKERNNYVDDAKKIIGFGAKDKSGKSAMGKGNKQTPGDINNVDKLNGTTKRPNPNSVFTPDEKLAKLTPKLDDFDKMKVKQRILNHSIKIYDKFDLKKILIFWRNNMNKEEFVNRKKTTVNPVKNKKEEEDRKLKESTSQQDSKADDKNNNNNIIHIKQSFAQPNENVKKLIPFFNNIYTIQKNEA
jgi:hypothetical protein